MPEKSEATKLVLRLGGGDSAAGGELLPLVYDELRGLAAHYLRSERTNHTLQPTALVHEAYLRLIEADRITWRGRAQFLALAASQIRKVLVDHARRKRAGKRGGDARNLVLDDGTPGGEAPDPDLIALDEALGALAGRSERQSRVVELRFFAGMTVPEVAEVLEVSPTTVKNDWRAARAWLRQRMV
jgi:RNA polymerase sigma factor (TIGR02999 family)